MSSTGMMDLGDKLRHDDIRNALPADRKVCKGNSLNYVNETKKPV